MTNSCFIIEITLVNESGAGNVKEVEIIVLLCPRAGCVRSSGSKQHVTIVPLVRVFKKRVISWSTVRRTVQLELVIIAVILVRIGDGCARMADTCSFACCHSLIVPFIVPSLSIHVASSGRQNTRIHILMRTAIFGAMSYLIATLLVLRFLYWRLISASWF